jgi:exopolyphosphatase/guanosine-5'-triphosphate,3'-diphosphate pyrophosphatase
MATEIIGLYHQEREIVANIVRYNHTAFRYYEEVKKSGFDREIYLVVAKLTAILRLANSLDRSHKQKLKGLKATLQDNELILNVETQEDITLEITFFDKRTEFFKEVFSITPILKQKKNF